MALPHTNRTIAVSRLSAGGVRTYTQIISGLAVYINSVSADVELAFDAGSTKRHRMLTSANHAQIVIGDRVVDDKGVSYEVTGSQEFDDLTGKHNQYVLSVKNG